MIFEKYIRYSVHKPPNREQQFRACGQIMMIVNTNKPSLFIVFHHQISLPINEIESISSLNNDINNFFNEEEY